VAMLQKKMRVLTITLLTIINIAVQGQTIKRPVDFSPDKKFGLLITIDGPDSFPEWKYWIINEQNDTTLLSTTVTHDELPPPTFWSKTSKKIISEDQTHEKIIIYNLNTVFMPLWGLSLIINSFLKLNL
jgi:hypothetical protein